VLCSVRIDVDQLLQEREEERLAAVQGSSTSMKKSKKASTKHPVKKETEEVAIPMLTLPKSKKRKSDVKEEPPKLKKIKITHSPSKLPSTISIPARPQAPKVSVTLKLGPRPTAPEPYPCCLCISMNKEGLLRVHDPPVTRKDAIEATGNPKVWMAHELCASVIPETWVDEIYTQGAKEKMVFGVDGIVKDRWNLVRHPRLIEVLIVTYRQSILEMFCMHQEPAKRPWRTGTVHERKVPESISCWLRQRWC